MRMIERILLLFDRANSQTNGTVFFEIIKTRNIADFFEPRGETTIFRRCGKFNSMSGCSVAKVGIERGKLLKNTTKIINV